MTASDTDDANLVRLVEARLHDPFQVLGRHAAANGRVTVRIFNPLAATVHLMPGRLPLAKADRAGLFQWTGPQESLPDVYRIHWTDREGGAHEQSDPYAFPNLIDEQDLESFAAGRHHAAYRFLGAHIREINAVSGVHFAVWAPNAERVSVVGDFNRWDGRQHPMAVRGTSGVWELFIPNLAAGTLYKYEIRNRTDGSVHVKADPYGNRFETPPRTASIVAEPDTYCWRDREWTSNRPDWQHGPVSIYEVHLGSWRRNLQGSYLDYRSLARLLVEHVKACGFTHIQLLPVTEHPFDASWGYQTTGYFAPTARFGVPDDFRYFVDYCHQHRVGVLLDWAPGHFPDDPHGLARFDGTALYEHDDPRRGTHPDWNTLVFNYGRNEVRSFLISSALYWLHEFHLDGLRVDAVASMLYLDYSRAKDQWLPNEFGGRENLEAIDFLRELNKATHAEASGTVTIAEESTAWPMVSRPVWSGGLGFSMKWNMGWMHDTLQYMRKDPIYRHYHHELLTFGMLYAFSENFVLPLSHDEVVHGKGSLLGKFPGDEWQRFANLRLLYTYQFTYPGKKHVFMGGEFGSSREWNHDLSLDWESLERAHNQGVIRLIEDLNRVYGSVPALHYHDFGPQGFEWIDCHDAAQSVISYLRMGPEDICVTVLNFTPVPRFNYRIGVPLPGNYTEVLNSDSRFYGGSDVGNLGSVTTAEQPWMGRPYSLQLTLPPLGGIVLRRVQTT